MSSALSASPHVTDTQSHNHLSVPLLGSLLCIPVSLGLGSPAQDPAFQVCLTSTGEQKRISTQPRGNALPDTAPSAAGLCCKDCVMVHLVLQDPQGLSCKADFQLVGCSLCWYLGLFLPRGRISWWGGLVGWCLFAFQGGFCRPAPPACRQQPNPLECHHSVNGRLLLNAVCILLCVLDLCPVYIS